MPGVPDVARDTDLTLRGQTAPAPTTRGTLMPTRMMQGHTDGIEAVAFFKDSRRAITGSYDKTLRIWDVETGALVGVPFKGHTDWVRSVTVSQDNRRIASGGDDNTIIIWDVESNYIVFGPLVKHTGMVRSVCFSPDGKRLASGSNDKTVVVWNAETGAVHATLEGHSNYVLSVAFSPDGLKLASGSHSTIRVWRADNAKLLFKFCAHQHWVQSVVWHPDGQQLVSASFDKRVKFWNSSNGYLIGQPCTDHTDEIYSLAISYDGSFIATASNDKTVRLWSTKTHRHIGQPLKHTTSIGSVTISPNGELLVTGDHNGNVLLWSIKEILEQHNAGETTKDNEGAQRQQLLTLGDVQPCSHDSNNELSGNNDGASDHASQQPSGTDDNPSLFDIPAINTPLLNACITEDLHTAEYFLTQETDAANNNHDSCANKEDAADELIKHDEEAQRQQLPSRSDTHLLVRGHENEHEPTGGRDSPSNHPSETDQASASDDNHSLFDILAINKTARNACITGDLHIAEDLLTQEIDADGNNHDSYANRSVVRARNSEWDKALQDSVKSIAIQPSLLGHISKAIALCGNKQLWDASEAFDLAFVFSNRDPIIVGLLLLIKAIVLFNAGHHDEAMRRVHDLATACHQMDTLPCSIVNSYLRVQLAIIAFDDRRYSEAADRLSIPSITDLFSRKARVEPRWKIFTVLFGWDLDSLWQTVNQRRCDALLRADRVIEAVEAHQYTMRMIDEDAKESHLEWSTTFKENCTVRCLAKGDKALTASNYEAAIELYSAGIRLDSSCESLFAHRSKANLEGNLYVGALFDAEKVIELDPSSFLGYELKHAALHGAQRYDEAMEAFKTMLSKSDDASHVQIRKLHQQYQYVSPSDIESIIRQAIDAKLENAPLRLINTSTGRMCNREAQIKAFMESAEYKEISPSTMMYAPLQMEPIKTAVAKYFSWAMLSHRWQSNELLLHNIQDKVVYDLDPVGTTEKLQTFCKIARDAGHRWAWSDTCCIDQKNNVELQASVNSMFVWYRHSGLTIVYLPDVLRSSKSGTLANSVWNTRGWTVQEFLAPSIVLFYRADWSLYLDDHSSNHKESATIMQELRDSTGIDARALAAFQPGMRDAREKLQWASKRVTTFPEDIAYSLFGIFGVHLPVIYGEMKQNALGRLLQEIVAQSGDITALDWVGTSSQFNSCLPADITSYHPPPCIPPSLSEDQIQALISSLGHATVVERASALYTRLNHLSAPRFANRRLQLPCIVFPITEVRRSRRQDQETCFTYYVKAQGLKDLVITTEARLVQFSWARPTQQTFLLVRPWNRHDLGLPDFTGDRTSNTLSVPWSLSDHSLYGSPEAYVPAGSESHGRALRLIARLGQPFVALLLAQQRGGEYKRIASDNNIIAQVKDMASVTNMMDVETLEIL